MENLYPTKIAISIKFYPKILTLALLPGKVWLSIGAKLQGEMFFVQVLKKGIHPHISTCLNYQQLACGHVVSFTHFVTTCVNDSTNLTEI